MLHLHRPTARQGQLGKLPAEWASAVLHWCCTSWPKPASSNSSRNYGSRPGRWLGPRQLSCPGPGWQHAPMRASCHAAAQPACSPSRLAVLHPQLLHPAALWLGPGCCPQIATLAWQSCSSSTLWAQQQLRFSAAPADAEPAASAGAQTLAVAAGCGTEQRAVKPAARINHRSAGGTADGMLPLAHAPPRPPASSTGRASQASAQAAAARGPQAASVCSRAGPAPAAAGLAAGTAAGAALHGLVLPPDLGLPVQGPIAVAVSGGVDSAAAAWLLKQQGHELVGVFMRNWDEREEVGNQNCSVEADLAAARHVCRRLDIPFHEANFVQQYWTDVFQKFLDQYEQGLTPNPDLACNRLIKFDSLLQLVRGLGAGRLATGHYARLLRRPGAATPGERVTLLRAADHTKDQSFWLSSVPAAALEHCLFPVGHLRKTEVRALVAEQELVPPNTRSSAGICFIGRRKFDSFLAQYIAPTPGLRIDIETGRNWGWHDNLQAVSIGQRPKLAGAPVRPYVVGKDMPRRLIYICLGSAHPARSVLSMQLHSPAWVAGGAPPPLQEGRPWLCDAVVRNLADPVRCWVCRSDADSPEARQLDMGLRSQQLYEPNAFINIPRAVEPTELLHLRFLEPQHAIAPEQAIALYSGDVCCGSALVQHPAATLHELLLTPEEQWDTERAEQGRGATSVRTAPAPLLGGSSDAGRDAGASSPPPAAAAAVGKVSSKH